MVKNLTTCVTATQILKDDIAACFEQPHHMLEVMKCKYDCAERQVVQLVDVVVIVVLSLILTRVRDPVLQTT